MDWVALAVRWPPRPTRRSTRPASHIGHVARVAAAVCGDDDAEVVAWLHDVAEDCPAFDARIEVFPHRCARRCNCSTAMQHPTRTATTRALPPTRWH